MIPGDSNGTETTASPFSNSVVRIGYGNTGSDPAADPAAPRVNAASARFATNRIIPNSRRYGLHQIARLTPEDTGRRQAAKDPDHRRGNSRGRAGSFRFEFLRRPVGPDPHGEP